MLLVGGGYNCADGQRTVRGQVYANIINKGSWRVVEQGARQFFNYLDFELLN